MIRVPFVSLTDRNTTDLLTPRPEPVSLLLAPLGLKDFANLSTGVRISRLVRPGRWGAADAFRPGRAADLKGPGRTDRVQSWGGRGQGMGRGIRQEVGRGGWVHTAPCCGPERMAASVRPQAAGSRCWYECD